VIGITVHYVVFGKLSQSIGNLGRLIQKTLKAQ